MGGAFFGGIDGLKEDAMEFGAVAASALVGHAAVGYAFKFISGQTWGAKIPAWAMNGGAILGGVLLGKAASHFGYRRAGLGLAAGAMVAGLAGFVKQYAPSIPLAGVALGEGYSTRALLMGLGDGSADALYQRYLSGAPTQVTETGGPFHPSLNGMGAAPVVVQQTNQMNPALNGAPVVVEQTGGRFAGLGKPGHPLFGGGARTFS